MTSIVGKGKVQVVSIGDSLLNCYEKASTQGVG